MHSYLVSSQRKPDLDLRKWSRLYFCTVRFCGDISEIGRCQLTNRFTLLPLCTKAAMEHKKLKHQAAGHDGSFTDTEEKLLFKLTIPKEVAFYTDIQSRKDNVDIEYPLECWMPTFVGTLTQGVVSLPNQKDITILKDEDVYSGPLVAHLKSLSIGGEQEYVVLENLIYGFNKPNILDIKLGKRLYDDDASEEKKNRLKLVSDSTTSGSMGLRICGMKIQKNDLITGLDRKHYECEKDDYVYVNKFYGRSRTSEDMIDTFKLYFSHTKLSKDRRAQLVHLFYDRLQFFYNTLLDEEVRMFSSSLLFIYEGDPDRWDQLNDKDTLFRHNFIDSDSDDSDDGSDSNEDEKHVAPLSSMSLIDFAHSKLVKGQGYDENVIEGVENMLSIFDNLCHIYK
ncbi:inositol polyphosphate multikinase Ecym_4203 [Eremothecium cymbalariae DBVPG|uniref:Kinase n=1 Tax=Eremothecium cymbalariae (strain CBS 270.75 / DBVPG 7215 / KCTC 17166 / NRRL Y-17582) TaxID=931890 RepID=G8JTB8_ERECY|nr:hypothetical protein Ecym_4203 [Eremothecium cymbalariae DBVPG\